MLIRAKWSQDTRVLFLSGRFDKSARVPLETALAAGEGRVCQKLILDFTTVSSLDSAGIGKLMLLYHSLRKKGVSLVIHNPRPCVEGLLQLVDLPTLIPVTHAQTEVRSVA
ncbi:MAG: STAS domain-containing protein [Nitrospirales bacterium]|nr:STAS domain-containing protein [Nitrospirales bacterium]